MEKTIQTESVKEFFQAIMALQNEEEYFAFFEDICTVNELLSIAQRFAVAKMLHEDKTYIEVAGKTGASTATISRVNRILNYGNGSFEMLFDRMGQSGQEETDEKQTRNRNDT